METTEIPSKKVTIINKYKSPSGGAHFLGFVGALIYFFQNAVTFSDFFFGLFKAIFWPAYAVYYLFKFFGL